MKRTFISIICAMASLAAFAVVPHRPVLPSVEGYVLLVGDCHIHTVFSDDTTWPTCRVDEADFDGLDFIAITDHCDSRLQKMVANGTFNADKVDRNTSYQLAASAAKKYGIMVIHGAELTRGKWMFPGHFNTLFIKDGNRIADVAEAAADKAKAEGADEAGQEEAAILEGLAEAKAQGAYIQWNHPDWERQAHNETLWWPIQTQVFDAGLMDGIEIVNRFSGYDPEAFGWAVEKNLNISAGTDCHKPMFQLVDYEKGEYRPMTLVFAKERSLAGIREAMDARRCCVIADNAMYGPADLLEMFFKSAFEISDVKCTSKKLSFKVRNNSSVPFVLTKGPGAEDVVYSRLKYVNAGEECDWSVTGINNTDTFANQGVSEIIVSFYVQNLYSNVGEPVKVSYTFPVSTK